MASKNHTQLVPRTIDGKTHMVHQPVDTPRPPRDWDEIVLRAVTAATGVTVAISLAWSIDSIGTLLSTTSEKYVAYGAAAIFDLAWITCMALEWLARYQPDKATAPRRAGHVALLVAMAALFANGAQGDRPWWVGLTAAAISALAKGLWTLTMRHYAKAMDDSTQQWVSAEMAELQGQLALAAMQRQAARSRRQLAAYHASYPAAPDTEDTGGDDPDKPRGHAVPVSEDMLSAVREAIAVMSGAAPEDIARQLQHAGITVPADMLPGQQDTRSDPILHVPGESIADTVRRAVRVLGDNPDAVLGYVRKIHGEDVKANTVSKTLSRVAPTKRAAG